MRHLVDERFAALTSWPSWESFAEGLARFPSLSPANVLLVQAQHPTATWLNSHRGWQVLERQPVARGIALLIPSIRHKRENGQTMWDGGRPIVESIRQRPTTVFDYSSTAGAHIPEPWDAPQHLPREGFMDDLRAAAAAVGYSVESRRDLAAAHRRVFTLIHGQDDRQKALHLAQQLGEVTCGEEGADLFAYALCMSNGMHVRVPDLPDDPQRAVVAARRGLHRVLQRTRFRHQR